jgi:hypothetical protein
VAEGGGLLNRYRGLNPYRGFESPSLRQLLLAKAGVLRCLRADRSGSPGFGPGCAIACTKFAAAARRQRQRKDFKGLSGLTQGEVRRRAESVERPVRPNSDTILINTIHFRHSGDAALACAGGIHLQRGCERNV